MKKFKDIFIGILIGCILMTSCPVLADSIMQKIDVVMNNVNVQVNGEKLETSTILYDGTTYLPMRKIAEAVGKDVDWNQETMTANIVAKVVTGSAIKPIDDVKVGDNVENEFKIYNIDDSFNCYAVKNNEIYYYALNIIKLINESANNGEYRLDISNLHLGNVRLYDKDNNTVIENIPYETIQSRIFISKSYYENTILPLIKK